MLIYAHRGWSRRFPENTLRAFSEAVALGVSGIEFDVRTTSDGVPVVIHDRELARTTNGTGLVDETALSTLRNLDAGDGERVPTLSEVLALVGKAVHLDIEIKARNAASAVLAELRAFPGVRWAISSFDWDVLRELREADNLIELWPLAVDFDSALLTVAAELNSPVVALENAAFTAGSSTMLHSAGLRAFLWTVNDPREAHRVASIGAYALCTDDPSLFVEDESRLRVHKP